MSETNVENDPVGTRREIVFVMRSILSNPNGDIDTGNRPRINQATGAAMISDVRLKRTTRDHLIQAGEDVYVQKRVKNGKVLTSEETAKELGVDQGDVAGDLCSRFIDVRLFGATLAAKGYNASITGPVQFNFGMSLGPPDIISAPVTSPYASAEGNEASSIGRTHLLSDSIFAFDGQVCPHNGERSGLTEGDLGKMYDAIWDGTNNLVSRSKVGQTSYALIEVESRDGMSSPHLLAHKVEKNDDGSVDFSGMVGRINALKGRVKAVRWRADPEVEESLLAALGGLDDSIEVSEL